MLNVFHGIAHFSSLLIVFLQHLILPFWLHLPLKPALVVQHFYEQTMYFCNLLTCVIVCL